LSFIAYNANGSGIKVHCPCKIIQKLEDGEPLGGKSKPEDDFGGLDDDEDLLG
jgi:hypothetical protein